MGTTADDGGNNDIPVQEAAGRSSPGAKPEYTMMGVATKIAAYNKARDVMRKVTGRGGQDYVSCGPGSACRLDCPESVRSRIMKRCVAYILNPPSFVGVEQRDSIKHRS